MSLPRRRSEGARSNSLAGSAIQVPTGWVGYAAAPTEPFRLLSIYNVAAPTKLLVFRSATPTMLASYQ